MNLSHQIKEYREKNQFSKKDLASKLNVSEQTISNWENDYNYPTIKDLLLVSEVFNVSVNELLKDDINIIEKIIKKSETNRSILCFIFIIILSFISYKMKSELRLIGINIITFLFIINFIAYLNPEMFRPKKILLEFILK